MKRLLALLVFMALPAVLSAQTVTVTWQWDPSDSAATAPVDNPVKYRLYRCADQALATCTMSDAGTALQLAKQEGTGTSFWYATAYWNGIATDGGYNGVVESGKSNVVKLTVTAPPGNPKNVKIKLYSIP